MSDLVACPNCGLSQSARHAFCARCDWSFDDRSGPPGATPAASGPPSEPSIEAATLADEDAPTLQEDAPTGTPSRPTPSRPTPSRGTPSTEPPRPPSRPSSRGGRKGAEAWMKPGSKVGQTSPSVPDPLDEEDLPDAPSWSMPGRALDEAAPGRGWGENTGRMAKRKPGLGRDRGSLTRRGHDRTPTGTPLSVDDREPTARMRRPTSSPKVQPPPRSHPGMPGSELRGRPPGNLYADEASSPPGDPLMAALVSGEEANGAPAEGPGSPPPVHPLYPEGMPSDSEFDALQTGESAIPLGSDSTEADQLPEDHGTPAPPSPAPPPEAGPSGLVPPGPRVVPPSTGRRTSTMGGRRAGSRSGARDPRGHRVASPPSQPGGIQPDAVHRPDPLSGSVSNDSLSSPGSSFEDELGGLSAVAAGPPPAAPPEPDAAPEDPLEAILPDLPLPPPPDLGGSVASRRTDTVRVVRNVGLVLVVVLGLVAARDGWLMMGHMGSLNAVLGTGQEATPALVKELDGEIARLGLRGDVSHRWARIEGAGDRFTIGVELTHGILGVPVTFTAERDGAFKVASKLATLEYFTDGGWDLDDDARAQLERYRESRRNR